MTAPVWIALIIGSAGVLAYFSASGWLWSAVAGLLLLLATYLGGFSPALVLLWFGLVFFSLFNVNFVRQRLLSRPLLRVFRKKLPSVSQTEREALEAGSIGWEGELFKGRPDWRRLLALPRPTLSPAEVEFINGPVEELCGMLDDWQITHELFDLPPEVWKFIKAQGFLGMIIPKTYGGLGFSALAHSEVIAKLSSRSGAAAVSVMVPNSLGPAELLLHYGTDLQKQYFLPRLAKGLEMPCFALTSPEAGSDAASMPDKGIVVRQEFAGNKNALGILLNWDKRYITLAPIATLLGLAFRLHDPDHLLGNAEDLGITLALIPTETPGVEIGRRHVPLDAAFQNGPTQGKNVFIPMDWIIGGQARIGQGWRMLMECLAAGRAISLPSNAAGAAKLAARATGAYARVRVQFKMPIGYFEGVEEALARIAANTYLIDAARVMTAGAVDNGEKPAVASAMVKYHLTERSRKVINDAMDVHAGKAIILGPNNYLGRLYQHLPIAITVEGANILTRSLIIFGQGAIRCHPYLLAEIAAAQNPDSKKGLNDFDFALTRHLRYLLGNAARSLFLGVTGGRGLHSPAGSTRRYYQQLSRFSAAFALLADVSLLILGGALKRREKLSARLGDIFSLLYLSSSMLKRFEDEGQRADDLPLLRWAMADALVQMQMAFNGVLQNFPNRFLGKFLGLWVFPFGQTSYAPSDFLGHKVARILMQPSSARDRLTAGIFISLQTDEPLRLLENALISAVTTEPLEQKLRRAIKDKLLPDQSLSAILRVAQEKNILNAEEVANLQKAWALRDNVIRVDDFSPDFARHEQVVRKPAYAFRENSG